MAAVLARLKELHEKVGNVGVDKLLAAAKKEGLAVNKRLVQTYQSTDASAQIFRPLPQSKGKTGSEEQGMRLQFDLIDQKARKVTYGGVEWSVILIIQDVFSRRVWGAPCRSKAPNHVAPVFRRLLNEIRDAPGITKIQIMSSDAGREWLGDVADLLESRDIVHKTVDKSDPNILSVLDRAIQTFRRRLAQSLADKNGPWPARVGKIIAQMNDTSHPALHGDDPAAFNKEGHEVQRFLTEQDNALKLKANQKLLEKRKQKLAEDGTYRVPVGGLTKFKRGFHQAYSSDTKAVDRVEGSTVVGADGSKVDIKRVMPVHEFSGEAREDVSGVDPRVSRKKDILITPLMQELYAWMDPGERTSFAAAAAHLKEEMGKNEYQETLKRAGVGHLVHAVEMFDEFEVEPGGYYFRRL